MDCFGFDAKDCVNGVGGIADRREHMLTAKRTIDAITHAICFPEEEVVNLPLAIQWQTGRVQGQKSLLGLANAGATPKVTPAPMDS